MQEENVKNCEKLKKQEQILDNETFSEAEWRQWQISYGDRRAKTFRRILEAMGFYRTRLP
jgi:hypothetical protein